MVSVELVKRVLISRLKGYSPLTTYLGGSDEIREYEWRGGDFTYPAVRVRVNRLDAQGDTCPDTARVNVSIFVYSEMPSSLQANQISDIIAGAFSDPFEDDDVQCALNVVSIIPPVSQGKGLWRGELLLNGMVSQKS